MAITIDVDQREALYGLLRLRISGLGDVNMVLEKRAYVTRPKQDEEDAAARRMRPGSLNGLLLATETEEER